MKKSLLFTVLLLIPMFVTAKMEPSAIFSDGMVLQRDVAVPVWGEARPGERVTVVFANQKKQAIADDKGRWMLWLDPLTASTNAQQMLINGKGDKVVVQNVLVGVVWLASGQSNMAVPMHEAFNPAEEIAHANNPLIREFAVEKKWELEPQTTLGNSRWIPVTPETARDLSAVGYFFARELNSELNVPVGIIHSAFNSSNIETWLPEAVLAREAQTSPLYAKLLKANQGYTNTTSKALRAESEMLNNAMRLKDPGNAGVGRNWHLPRTDVSKWKEVPVPSLIQTHVGEYNGAFWFRRDITIPPEWVGQDLTLELGAIDDFDITYFNGEEIGETRDAKPEWWALSRVYTVPSRLVKAGRNVIAVRVFDERHAGGMVGEKLQLIPAAGEGIDLAGIWRFKPEHQLTQMPFTGRLYTIIKIFFTPAFLHNAMLNPLIPYAIDGVIWYQGESNNSRAQEYRILFADLIRFWRESWSAPELPFYFVQLAAYHSKNDDPNAKSNWAELRDAQQSVLSVPRTGLVTALDIGDETRIHPLNKQEVGLRLARQALAKRYGKPIACESPIFKLAKLEGAKVRIQFDHAQGLTATETPLKGFAIAGADGTFVWANAEVAGKEVVVWSDVIAEPKQVRYAWADNPDMYLFNGAKLPALPFSVRID